MSTAKEGRGFNGDTSRETLREQFAALRRLTPSKRLALMDELTSLAQSICREGLRRRHPGISEAELDEKFADLVLGRELAAKVRESRRAKLERSEP